MKRIKKTLTLVSMAVLLLTACEAPKELGVVPYPQYAQTTSKTVELPSTVTFSTNLAKSDMNDLLAYLPDFAIPMKLVDKNPFVTIEITDATDNPIAAEGYNLTVSKQGVNIQASSAAGAFYGLQTLAQLARNGKELPVTTIKDEPRFPYRGLHLDVSRHFFNTDYVKKQIDLVATYKINRLHWHLTDGAGWRLEIPGYPRLTEFAAWRKAANLQDWGKYDHRFCEKNEEGAYGGYYTEADVREVLEYARLRHVTVIPEIEMPGHSGEVLAAYPQLSCTGKPYTSGEVCIGNEETFKFFEDVLDEVIRLFPSRYIHIGGDEASRRHWKTCPKCQKRMKEEGLKDESELQSYMIARIEKYLNDKGREIIGWDEILEGGLAPNATVMSWRGMDGGIEAAKQKHNVVMTPNTYVYLDYYQSADTDLEPEAIGGYLPLEKVYSFEPTAGISPEDQKYVIGAQANLWTEYIPTFSQVEYMIMPRIDAVADIQWSDPSKKDYQTFLPRVARMTQLYDRLGYNYGKHIFDINASLTTNTENGTLDIALTKLGEGDIYYTVDGSDPTIASIKYEGPVQINQDCEFKAIVVRPNGTSRIFSEDIFFNKATMKPITLKEQPSKGYVFNGAQVLVDGLRGGSNYKTGHWLGFQGKDLDATIDLKEPTEIQKVSFNTNVVKGDWIMGASAVTVKVSDDGKNFKEVASKKIPELTQNDKDGLYPQEISFAPVKARYVEVIINSSKLPKWHGGAGSPAFLFVDEIEIL